MNRCMYPGCQNQSMNTCMRSAGCPQRRSVNSCPFRQEPRRCENSCPLRPEPRRCENSRTVRPESCERGNSCPVQKESCKREDSCASRQNSCKPENTCASRQNSCKPENSCASRQNSCKPENSCASRQNSCRHENSCQVRPEPRKDKDCGHCEKDCRPSMSRCQLLQHINEVSFAVDDILLYLNTHPCDQEALCFYRKNAKERDRALKEYAKYYGPLTVDTAVYNDSDKWEWVTQPFPWEKGGAY